MAFTLITEIHSKKLMEYLFSIRDTGIKKTSELLHQLMESIREDIPQKRRISLGRYSIIYKMGEHAYRGLKETDEDIYTLGFSLYECPAADPFVRSLGIQILTLFAVDRKELKKVLPWLEKAACSEDWLIRECCSGFVRKLIPGNENIMQNWYQNMAKSGNPLKRRFASESLRPVADNRWLRKKPEFCFAVLENLFEESDEYPRTSVGNSLSDWMRIDQEHTLPLVKKLAASGNKNSYWIAYRACRNLVKKEPLLVMDLLKTDQYIYKKQKYFRDRI